MQMPLLSARIPESQLKYIKLKAVQENKQIKQMVSEVIDFYQQHDTEYMAKLNAPTPNTTTN